MHMTGGFIGHGPAPIPQAARRLWPGSETLWTGDGIGLLPVRTAEAGTRKIAAIGFCGATDAELFRVAEHGVGEHDVFRWPGAYCLI